MGNKLLDLKRIPAAKPYLDYGTWLDWKCRQMVVGDSFRMPIFSAFTITRWFEGFVIFDTSTQCFYAFRGADGLANFIEQRDYQPDQTEVRLARLATVYHLSTSGYRIGEIAKLIQVQRPLVRHDQQALALDNICL